MLSIEQLTQETLSLPSASRALLAEKLVESLEFDINPAIQTDWNTEPKKRRDEIRSGAVRGISGEEGLAEVILEGSLKLGRKEDFMLPAILAIAQLFYPKKVRLTK